MAKDVENGLKVKPIKNGTVIDHIPAGMALKVMRIINIAEPPKSTVSIVMMVPSERSGHKDMIKVEDVEIKPRDIDKIALVAPGATINYVRNHKIAKKHNVKLPGKIKSIVNCNNPSCITNQKEPIETEFTVQAKEPIALRCKYCDKTMTSILENIE